MANLEELVIRGSMKTLPPAIAKLSKLRRLVLGKTKLSQLPDEICEIETLEEIDATGTVLRKLPDDIGRLTKLRALRVGSGNFKKLPASIVELANLRQLHIPWCVDAVPAGFDRLTLDRFEGPFDLEKMLTMMPPSEDENEVHLMASRPVPTSFGDPITLYVDLPKHRGTFPQLAKLRRLETLRLEVMDLDDALEQLVGARRLAELSLRESKVIPESLGKLTSIVKLMISDATNVPDSIGKLTRLEELSLWTAPRALPATLAKCKSLRWLRIDDASKIANLDVLATVASLRSVCIGLKIGARKLVDLCAATQLEELTIEDREVKQLPVEIAQLTALKELLVCRTAITTLPTLPASLRKVYLPHRIANAKALLPEGRWRRGTRRDFQFFER